MNCVLPLCLHHSTLSHPTDPIFDHVSAEGAVTSEYEIVSWGDLETDGKVICKDCWANLGTEVELLVDWDEYTVIMNEFTAQVMLPMLDPPSAPPKFPTTPLPSNTNRPACGRYRVQLRNRD